ncbi:MAG: hypothetical protein IJR62_01785 [Lachnospiraceae bacterium]|nr:hypothetical protein [Lachnospiraceae bacterium]
MFTNKLQEKIRRGEKTVGTFLGAGNASIAEAIGYSGLDYIIIDTEHGPYEAEGVMEIMRGAELGGTTALVRVKDCSRPAILKMMDIGARGLIIPQVHTVEEVRQVVDYAKYYPTGNRGVCFSRADGYGYDEIARQPLTDFFRDANARTLIIPQCETAGCLEHIEEVCALEGVAGIFIGPFDLSVAMGMPGRFDDPDFQKALDRILKAVHDAGKFCIMFSTTTEAARKYFARGFDSVTVSLEYDILITAMQRMMAEAKA